MRRAEIINIETTIVTFNKNWFLRKVSKMDASIVY